ncbi:MAG: CBS domain-containing protein [Planctomycetes bacterium]|nr:CBS domain-containing protein [Planctomycetota bacterium]
MNQIKDVMTERVFAVGPNATIDQAISLLLDHRVSGLPVVDDEGLLLGVITEFDIIGLVYNADIEASIVGDYMTKEVNSLDVEASLDDAANIFCNDSIRRIPIVRDGRLVGVLSRHDLISFVREVRRQTSAV